MKEQSKQSFQGLDVCGQRLVDEIKAVIERRNFKKISFFGHSFGGILSRYAIGQGYDKNKGTIFGLLPIQYTSVCSPHLGCAIKGEAEIPVASWIASYFPFVNNLTPTIVYLIYNMTGRQLFYNDNTSAEPIFSQIAKDNVRENKYYISALKSFRSRTCYGNVNFDQNVSWCNSTLRTQKEAAIILEDLRKNRSQFKNKWKGIIKSDPIEMSYVRKKVLQNDANGHNNQKENNLLSNVFTQPQKDQLYATQALHNLTTLTWRRIDHAWDDASFLRHICGHTFPMVVRPKIDWEGYEVMTAIVENFVELESHLDR